MAVSRLKSQGVIVRLGEICSPGGGGGCRIACVHCQTQTQEILDVHDTFILHMPPAHAAPKLLIGFQIPIPSQSLSV